MVREKECEKKEWRTRRIKLTVEEDAILTDFAKSICYERSSVLRYLLSVNALYYDEKKKIQLCKILNKKIDDQKDYVYISIRLPKKVTDIYESFWSKRCYTGDYYRELLKESLKDMKKALERENALNRQERTAGELLEEVLMEGVVGK